MKVIHNKTLDHELIIKNERERISSLIHNQFAQDLTALWIHSQAIQSISKNNEVLMHINYISNLIKNSRENVRDLIWSLNSSNNDPAHSLVRKTRELLMFWKETDDSVLQKLDATGDLDNIPSHLSSICFEVIKEAITNVYRHAESENLSVNIAVTSSYMEILVSDDGIGFDAEFSNGLNGMNSRLESVGGVMQIHTKNKTGTSLFIKVPLFNGH